MNRRFMLLFAGLTAAGWTAADELYGPPLAADLGRVFLAPTERREIERRRWSEPAEEQQPGEETSSPPAKRDVFGLIVGPNRKPLVWIDGEFRKTKTVNPPQDLAFEIKRSAADGTDTDAEPEH